MPQGAPRLRHHFPVCCPALQNMTQGRSLEAVTTAAGYAEKANRDGGGVHTELSSGLIV